MDNTDHSVEISHNEAVGEDTAAEVESGEPEVFKSDGSNIDIVSSEQSDTDKKSVGKKAKIKIDLSRQNVLSTVKYFAVLVVLAAMRALFTYVFIIPNGFAPGGVGGISSIIYNAVAMKNAELANTWLAPGLTTFLMNIPLLIAAFIVLNKRFAFNTLCVVGVYSAFMTLLQTVDCPQYVSVDGDGGVLLIAAIAGGAGSGLGMGFMLRSNMSMGGTDIIGKIIYKHNPAADVQWWILACDSVVVVASGVLGIITLSGGDTDATTVLTKILTPILYSFISLFTCSSVADTIQSGLQSSLVFNIISDKPDEIAKLIVSKLKRGVTISKGVGYYTGKEHEVLLCVTSKKQINTVKTIVAQADPDAFMYIMRASEVSGNGFSHFRSKSN